MSNDWKCSVTGCTRENPFCHSQIGVADKKTPALVGIPGQLFLCKPMAQLLVDHFAMQDALGKKKEPKAAGDRLMTVKELSAAIRRVVWGQDAAVAKIALAIYGHNKNREVLERGHDVHKTNVLMVGPTGVGKTYIMQTAAKIAGMPFYVFRGTPQLTKAGYVGKNIEDIIQQALPAAADHMRKIGMVKEADDPRKVAEYITKYGMIIGVDEVDKIAQDKGRPGDVGGESVQDALLTLLEGSEVQLNLPGPQPGTAIQVTVDTTNIMFILAGAFMPAGGDDAAPMGANGATSYRPSLRKIIHERLEGTQAAFGDRQRVNRFQNMGSASLKNPDGDIFLRVIEEDIVKFGFKPEFVGRAGIIAALRFLDSSDLIKILTEVQGNVYTKFRDRFAVIGSEFGNMGYGFEIAYDALEELARRAATKGTGARALGSELSKACEGIMEAAPELSGEYDEILLTLALLELGHLPLKADGTYDTEHPAWPFRKKGGDGILTVLPEEDK